MWQYIKTLAGVMALGAWFTSYAIWMFYSAHRPKACLPNQGRTFPLDTHGAVVYLTATGHYGLYALMVTAAGCFLLAALAGYESRQNRP